MWERIELYFRNRSTPKVFPIEATDRTDSLEVKQIGQMNREGRTNLNQYRVYETDGIAPTLTDMQGGVENLTPSVDLRGGTILDTGYQRIDGTVRVYENIAPTLRSRDYKEPLMVVSSLIRTNTGNPGTLPTQSQQGKTGE